MRLIPIHALKAGMVVGRAIWKNGDEHPLLQKNMILTDSIIERLRKCKIQYLYVEEKLSNDFEDAVPQVQKQEAINDITATFQNVKETTYILEEHIPKVEKLTKTLLHNILENEEIVTILTDTYLYNKDIFQHSFNVAIYTLVIAKELGFQEDELKIIALGALLHDVGKMVIPQKILKKPDHLTEDEFSIMKRHTEYGFQILHNIHTIPQEVAQCALQHHERIDGSGYPMGLIDCKIHRYAKIIAVADVFDALTSNRVYREKVLPSNVVHYIQEGSGKVFDKQVVEAFKKCVVH